MPPPLSSAPSQQGRVHDNRCRWWEMGAAALACEGEGQVDALQRHPVNLRLPALPVPECHGVAAHSIPRISLHPLMALFLLFESRHMHCSGAYVFDVCDICGRTCVPHVTYVTYDIGMTCHEIDRGTGGNASPRRDNILVVRPRHRALAMHGTLLLEGLQSFGREPTGINAVAACCGPADGRVACVLQKPMQACCHLHACVRSHRH